MGTYFQHWLDMQAHIAYPPKIFTVNWFRQDKDGKFLWPGFGENMRVIKWMFERIEGKVGARKETLGWIPTIGDLDFSGLDKVGPEAFDKLVRVDANLWQQELESHKELFDTLKDRLPQEFLTQQQNLKENIK
jgi:phosphoenolpyruvate carboxykinase (GTP)